MLGNTRQRATGEIASELHKITPAKGPDWLKSNYSQEENIEEKIKRAKKKLETTTEKAPRVVEQTGPKVRKAGPASRRIINDNQSNQRSRWAHGTEVVQETLRKLKHRPPSVGATNSKEPLKSPQHSEENKKDV